MKGALLGAAAAVLLAGGCTRWGMFEDVGSDPHPPTLRVLALAVVEPEPPPAPPPEPPPEPPAARARGVGGRSRVVPFDSQGFTVRVGDSIDVLQEYSDAGADVVVVRLRDRDSSLSVELKSAPDEIDTDGDGVPDTELGTSEFFPGTRGLLHIADGLEFDVHQIGPHRIEMWAEDSHESRSEKVEFVVNVIF